VLFFERQKQGHHPDLPRWSVDPYAVLGIRSDDFGLPEIDQRSPVDDMSQCVANLEPAPGELQVMLWRYFYRKARERPSPYRS